MYMQIIGNEIDHKEKYEKSFTNAINSLQAFRVFRLFRLAKYTSGFRVLAFTLRASAMDLLLLLLCLFTAVMTFSALAYFFFKRWSIYQYPSGSMLGDYHIENGWLRWCSTCGTQRCIGKLIASACAITGVCLLPMLMPMLINNFLLFFNHSKVIEKRGKGRRYVCMLKDTRYNCFPGQRKGN